MHTLLDGIPLGEMNTSMTINATAAWLLALYIVTARGQRRRARPPSRARRRTTSSRSSSSRGTYAFPPGPSMRLIADMVAFTVDEVPKWNPINICCYHLQEAGATPVQEIAYALSNAIAVLDAVRERVDRGAMGAVFGRISFFVNAGVRFVEEHAKLRAMGQLWEEIGRERYGVTDEAAALPLRRAGQLARADRVAAGEQRARASCSRRWRSRSAATRAPARSSCRVERGARPAAPVGSAVVAAHPADPRLRDRPARVPRHLRGLEGHGGTGRRARRGRDARRWRSSRSTAARSRRCRT